MKKVFLFLFCMLFALGGNLVFADDGNDKKEIKFVETDDYFEENPHENVRHWSMCFSIGDILSVYQIINKNEMILIF